MSMHTHHEQSDQNGNEPTRAATKGDRHAGLRGVVYVTALGKEIEIVGVSPFEIDQVRQTVAIPPVPTRQVETAVPGFVEEEPLTADNLLNDEERATWARYVRERRAAEIERNERVTNFILLEGTRFEQDDLEAWQAKRERWGMPVPEDPLERVIAYYRTAVLGSADDLEFILSTVMERQGVDEATLQSVRATFQREIRQHTAAAVGDTQRQVELLDAVSGDARGESLEHRPA